MKKLFLILLCVTVLSCTEESVPTDEHRVVENISVRNSETLEFYLGGQPIEGGPYITTEPDHANISKIEGTDRGMVYFYQAKAGFTGSDVVIITNDHSNGADVYAQTITRLNIKVTE